MDGSIEWVSLSEMVNPDLALFWFDFPDPTSSFASNYSYFLYFSDFLPKCPKGRVELLKTVQAADSREPRSGGRWPLRHDVLQSFSSHSLL